MTKIECITKRGNPDTFSVETKTDEVLPILRAVCEATLGAKLLAPQPETPETDAVRLLATVENALALQATGFVWSEDAAKTAIRVLADAVRKAQSLPRSS